MLLVHIILRILGKVNRMAWLDLFDKHWIKLLVSLEWSDLQLPLKIFLFNSCTLELEEMQTSDLPYKSFVCSGKRPERSIRTHSF